MKPRPNSRKPLREGATRGPASPPDDLFRDIVERSMEGIFIVQDDIIRFVNPRLAEMYGGPIEEVLGTTLSEHVYPDDRPQAVDRYKRRLAGEPVSPTYETRLLRKDGTAVWAAVSGGVIIYEGRPADLLFVREVDERKKAEAALKASEEKYRAHIENISDVVYSLDRELHVLTISPSVEKILGYKPEEIIGRPLPELPFVTPGSLRIAQNNIPRILAGETITATVYEFRAKDGHTVIGEVSGTPLFQNGKIMGLVASARDITERRASETALAAGIRELEASKKNAQQAQAVLRSILESPPDVVLFALDRKFRYLAFNQNHKATMKTIWGADIEAGVSMLDYIGEPADRQKARRNFERALDGEAFVVDEEFGDVGLQRRYYEDRYSPIRAADGAVIGLTVFLTDVTERHRVAEAFQESRERLDLALRSAHMGVWEWNIPENLRYFDDQTCRLLGIESGTFGGKESEFFAAIHAEDRAGVKAALEASLERGAPYEEEYRAVWPDGSVRYITARGTPVRDAAGRPVKISGIIWDSTERRRADEELRRSEARFSGVFHSSPMSIAIIRIRDNVVIDVNAAWEQMTGFRREEAVGCLMTDLGLWVDPRLRERLVRGGAGDSRLRGLELAIHRKSGNEIDVLMSAERIELAGEPCLLTMAVDITDRRKAEEALKALALRHEALLAAVPEIVVEVDTNKVYVWANKAGIEFFGDDIVGKEAAYYFEGENDVYTKVQPVFDGQEEAVYIETWQRRRDGRKRLLAWWCRSLEDIHGNVRGALSSARDITDARLAEEDMRRNEAQLSNAMTIARLGYWEYDVDKDEFVFNDHFYDIFRTTAEKVGGYRISSRRYAELFVHPDDAFIVAAETGKALSAPDPFYSRQLEHRVIFADGEIGFISVHIYVIKDKEGRTIRTYGANQDITERKRAEIAVLASLKEKEVLLRELHHRVKNNMQIISSLLNLQAAHLKDPVVIQVFKDTQRRIRSMALVHEKLYQSENLSTIGFENYLESLAVHLFHSYETEAAGIELVTDMDRILLDIQTAIPCGLLVNELLSNALKHAFPGGRKGRVEIGLHRLDDGRISLRIKDDGIGLPSALDVENTKTLGLQIVSSLISQLDGTLEISREGGTEFRIFFKEAKYAQRL